MNFFCDPPPLSHGGWAGLSLGMLSAVFRVCIVMYLYSIRPLYLYLDPPLNADPDPDTATVLIKAETEAPTAGRADKRTARSGV